MNGPIGLHGGGEYEPGDEPFLDVLIAAARTAAGRRLAEVGASPELDVTGHRIEPAVATVRVVILPTAAARGRPERAAEKGIAAFAGRAAAVDQPVRIDVAAVVDTASATDPANLGLLATADIIHLPGGDPDLVPKILAGSPALAAIEAAWHRGAVIAGASAGAMALAEWTWTPSGGVRGLGLVAGLAVVPHYDDIRRTAWQQALDRLAPGEIGYLGLDERTGAISDGSAAGRGVWRIAGAGAAYWFARDAHGPTVARDGETLAIPV